MMPDQKFELLRLVEVYDAFNAPRTDLDFYSSIVHELSVKSVIDIGSGTGTLAILLAEEGYDVAGVEPAKASIDYALSKINSDRVQWIHGNASTPKKQSWDLAVMAGNTAQVFLTDKSWKDTLEDIRRLLKSESFFVFEVRDPSKKAWLDWNKEITYKVMQIPNIGAVHAWCELTNVEGVL